MLGVAICYIVSNLKLTDEQGQVARIKVNNQLVRELDLFESGTYEFEFSSYTGWVEVESGAIRMQEMLPEICPRRICSETGWINKSYEMIVCLPNRITVEIVGAQGVIELDDVVY